MIALSMTLVPVVNILEALPASLARAKKPVSVSGALTAMPAAENAEPRRIAEAAVAAEQENRTAGILRAVSRPP